MHELAVTESILEIALRHGEQANASRITNLYLVIGDLSSIVDDSIQFYWDIISKGTLAEGARMNFHRIRTQLKCKNCGTEYSRSKEDLFCPDCESHQVEIITGDEFYLDAIDVET
jgi:hydrogenase nickel incorporation protein HypA/HybF